VFVCNELTYNLLFTNLFSDFEKFFGGSYFWKKLQVGNTILRFIAFLFTGFSENLQGSYGILQPPYLCKELTYSLLFTNLFSDVFNDRDRGAQGSLPVQMPDKELPLQQGVRPRVLHLQVQGRVRTHQTGLRPGVFGKVKQ
jgi:hypothetical protein